MYDYVFSLYRASTATQLLKYPCRADRKDIISDAAPQHQLARGVRSDSGQLLLTAAGWQRHTCQLSIKPTTGHLARRKGRGCRQTCLEWCHPTAHECWLTLTGLIQSLEVRETEKQRRGRKASIYLHMERSQKA